MPEARLLDVARPRSGTSPRPRAGDVQALQEQRAALRRAKGPSGPPSSCGRGSSPAGPPPPPPRCAGRRPPGPGSPCPRSPVAPVRSTRSRGLRPRAREPRPGLAAAARRRAPSPPSPSRCVGSRNWKAKSRVVTPRSRLACALRRGLPVSAAHRLAPASPPSSLMALQALA